MSGLCGWVGRGVASTLDAMVEAIAYRGDFSDGDQGPGWAMGYRGWQNRPHKAPGLLRRAGFRVACAGTFSPPPSGDSPTDVLLDRFLAVEGGGTRSWRTVLEALDGAFACALWDESRQELFLARDPFGVRSLYYVEHGGVFYFATELKQLLAIPGLPVELDDSALHKYLTFSFVPGEDVPLRGVKRLLPGHTLHWQSGRVTLERYFQLEESVDEALRAPKAAVRALKKAAQRAVVQRLLGESEVGLFLSGGLDSSSVATWLKGAGASIRAFSLDFGKASVEKEQAAEVASVLGLDLTWVPVTPEGLVEVFEDAVHKLDLPFGDPVTLPQYLLGKAARGAGLSCVFNGEGGDQLFGGWTSKPMIAAELYAGLYDDEAPSREETYLRSYHRFYGLEEELYTTAFRERVGPPGQRRALLRPYLGKPDESFLHRVRLADIALKGSQNILPRAERMANAWGLDVRSPFFDKGLAQLAFRLPPELKLHGACEKYVLKLAMQNELPESIVWRKKYGMSVPITDLLMSRPFEGVLDHYLGPRALEERGLFRPEFVSKLRQGQGLPGDTRRRRVGERLWTLLMLEAWMRKFVDSPRPREGRGP